MNKAILDTDIYSEVLKGVNPDVVRNAIAYREMHGVFTLTSITVMEVIQGLQKVGASSRRFLTLRNAVDGEEVLSFDRGDADLAGRISGDLDRIGRPIGRCDPMIAAMAMTRSLELVTGNMAHYQRLQSLGYPLTLANWRM